MQFNRGEFNRGKFNIPGFDSETIDASVEVSAATPIINHAITVVASVEVSGSTGGSYADTIIASCSVTPSNPAIALTVPDAHVEATGAVSIGFIVPDVGIAVTPTEMPKEWAITVSGAVTVHPVVPSEPIYVDVDAYVDCSAYESLYWTIPVPSEIQVIGFYRGWIEPLPGDIIRASHGHCEVVSVSISGGYWYHHNYEEDVWGTITVKNVTGYINTATYCSLDGKYQLSFYSKTHTPSIGETVTGAISGATSRIIGVSDTYFAVTDLVGVYEDEQLNFPGGHAHYNGWDDSAFESTSSIVSSNPNTVSVIGTKPLADRTIPVVATIIAKHPVMYYIMIDYTVTIVSSVDCHAEDPTIEFESLVEALISVLPVTPTAYIFIPPPTWDGSLQIGCSTSQTMVDKMMRATFEYIKSTTGESPDFYFKHITIVIPDYTATDQTVFSGFFPSGTATYAAEGNSEVFTAYDQTWYLTMQYLTDDNMVLLTPEQQILQKKYRLEYIDPTVYWDVGQIIQGIGCPAHPPVPAIPASGHIAKIIENHLIGAFPVNQGSYVILEIISGVPISGHYFTDGEKLAVNGVPFAYAYGHTTDVTGIVNPILPNHYICRLLGGDNTGSEYERITGIKPYRITSVSWSASSDPIAIDFVFEEKTTKMQAIEKICKYLRYVFLVKVVGDETVAYFVPEADIDTAGIGLDLPTPLTETNLNPYVVSPVTLERKGEERYNQVTVRCRDLDGVWIQSVLPVGGVVDDLPIEYYEINQDIASQDECDQRCLDLYTYYSNQIKTWNVTFVMRSDLRLLQKIVITNTDMPLTGDPWYRIVGIEYNYSDGGTTNTQVCTIIKDSQFKYWLNLNRVFNDTVSATQAIVQNELNKLSPTEVGTVTAVDGNVLTVMTERGLIKTVRDAA